MLEGTRAVDPNYIRLVDKLSTLAFGRPPIQKPFDGPRRTLAVILGEPYDPMKEQTVGAASASTAPA